MNDLLGLTALSLIALSAVWQIVYLLRQQQVADKVSPWLLLGGGVLLFTLTVLRSIAISFPAVTNTYEALVFFSAALCVVAFVLRMVAKNPVALRVSLFGATIIALAVAMISSSPLVPKDIQPPIPALQSIWLVMHVTLAFVGESFFAVAFIAALSYLFTKDQTKRVAIDRIVYTTTVIGYPIFTAGALVFGMIWANFAWGSYWSWDPKETWALITFLVYTAYLHTRIIMKIDGTVSAILAAVGFVFTVFTFAGVNFLLSGLHSYG